MHLILRVCVIVLALAAGASAAPQAKPVTLVYANGPIVALAQDGGRIAWASAKDCLLVVRIRTLATKTQAGVGKAQTNNCESDSKLGHLTGTRLALGGTRVLWTWAEAGNNYYTWIVTGGLGAKQKTVHSAVYAPGENVGEHFTGVAGDGSTLAYGIVQIGARGAPDCDLNGTCTAYVKGGGVHTLPGKVAGAAPPAAVAVSSGRVATVPSALANKLPAPPANAKVEVRNVATGALAASFVPQGTVRAVALAPKLAVVLVRSGGATRIERYAVPGGALLGATAVPSATAPQLSTNGREVVFRVGRSIRVVRSNGAITPLATTRVSPFDVSIEGTRVVWAENHVVGGKPRGRIQSVSA